MLIAHGSTKAVAELYDLVAPLLHALLRSRHSTVDQTEDALVGVFAQIWRTAPTYATGPYALDWIIDQTQGDARTGAPRRAA
ncbi:sigma-70 family RNA polymerase sigma factor [Streptomyces rubiginosohelvolus]|uniref:RNA polymerase sigma-70 region 2 domain-containing protein n=1 Tax=Streptomyces rubiginosohelvolus TaxID=67362 RepID=A0ABW6F489_9ACTN